MAPTTPSSLKSCNNPTCADFGTVNRDLLKCGKCKTITYCNRDCQRAHWPVHKQFCKVWQDSATNGESVREMKKRMGEFLWLIRSVPDYTDDLFKEYIASIREGRRGCIEFLFETYDDLAEAIRVLGDLPVLGKSVFHTMPGGPGYYENPEGMPITLRRRTTKREQTFIKSVDKRMAFSESDRETRPNLINLLNMAGTSERMLVMAVTMRLGGTYSTHSYDFLFKDINWRPEDAPTPPQPERLAIQGPDGGPALHRKISFDMD